MHHGQTGEGTNDMAFNKAGQKVKTVRARKTEAHRKYGRMKKIVRVELAPEDRKQSVSFSLPVWMVIWITEQAELKGMHKSTFLAALIDSSRAGLEAAERAVLESAIDMDMDDGDEEEQE
jgi:hypothetical protein